MLGTPPTCSVTAPAPPAHGRQLPQYQQTFIDTYTTVAFVKFYDRKTPLAAADLLYDRVSPFFDKHGISLSWVLTDRGTECCGRRTVTVDSSRARDLNILARLY